VYNDQRRDRKVHNAEVKGTDLAERLGKVLKILPLKLAAQLYFEVLS
jgi:hypothetical protein